MEKDLKIFEDDLADASNRLGDVMFSIMAVASIAADLKSHHILPGAWPILVGATIVAVIFSVWQAGGWWNINKRKMLLLGVYQVLLMVVMIFTIPVGSLYSILYIQLIYLAHYWYGIKGSVTSVILFILTIAAAAAYQHHMWDYETFATAVRLAAVVIIISISILSLHEVAVDRFFREREARQQMETEKRRLRSLMNNMSSAVVATNHDGIIIEYNASVLSMLDLEDDVHGKTFSEVFNIHSATGEQVDLIAQARNKDKPIERDDVFHIFDNRERVQLHVTVTPLKQRAKDKIVYGYTIVLRDITRAKSLEEQRSEFISIISHELRTPVAIVEGSIDKAERINGERLHDEEMSGALSSAHENVNYLARLMNDLTVLAMTEQDKKTIEVRAFAVADVIEELRRQFEEKAKAKGNTFTTEIGEDVDHIVSNQQFIQEVLNNLVSNAIKYTKDGQITVRARRLPSAHVIFDVIDTGVGIEKSDYKNVFEKFFQAADYTTREEGGAGLGLYVSKRLAERVNAKIIFKSELGKGSTFSLMVPPEPGIYENSYIQPDEAVVLSDD